ncbi:GNAT family N-acetyltransferase [Vibrio gangliei]|uniref:GNAT family N-acetyltransferase n=1 Tax=Vibrio gangliei TaxID=2077090 RepID=UPI000D01C4E5|nr:GNAT family protein [Vibrio gangliei]
MTPDHRLVTPRLKLRMITADESAIFAQAIQSSPSLYPWLDWCHTGFSQDEASDFIMHTRLNWVKNTAYGFGIYTQKKGELIGMVALTDVALTFNMGTIGYWICDQFQHKGYGKEATLALIDFCFSTLQLTRLECICDPDNVDSHYLAESCGGLKEGLARNRYLYDGKPKDGIVYSFIPE